jgi:hypothetical protein
MMVRTNQLACPKLKSYLQKQCVSTGLLEPAECERKILFRLKNKLKKIDYKPNEQDHGLVLITCANCELVNINPGPLCCKNT